MALMLVAGLCVAAMSACVRHVSSDVHPMVIGFFRAVFGLLAFAPFLLRSGLKPLKTRRVGLHAVRGILNVAGMLTYFTALSLAPLAKVTALGFSAPLFATVLAFLVLGETIRARRITALIVGYLGALVIVRPGFVALDTGSLYALASAAAWGLGMIVIKVLSRTESSMTITVYMTLFGMPIALLAAAPVWQTPTLVQAAWLAAIGILASLANLSVAQAFKEADLTAVLPLDFTKLIWASMIGYLVFAEVPSPWTWVGGIMIFSAATYIAFRERRTRTAPPDP
jgi:drug/metabolite transporter (DMT)-like permease